MKEINDFIRPEEAKYLMSMIDRYANRSMVVSQGKEMNQYSSCRTSYTDNLVISLIHI